MLLLYSNLTKNLALLASFKNNLIIIQNWLTIHWATLYMNFHQKKAKLWN